MTRDEAEQQYRETCDRMGTDADPGGVLAGGPMAESKADELRRLAQAVVDAWEEPAHMAYCHMKARELAGGINEPDAGLSVYSARAILAALDDATEQGRAAGDAAGYARGRRQGLRARVAHAREGGER